MFNAQCPGELLQAVSFLYFVKKYTGMQNRKYDLEDSLVDYTCRMIDVVEALPDTRSGNYIASQLIKSCHSPTFNYGEARLQNHLKILYTKWE
jgi:hypothetical protein